MPSKTTKTTINHAEIRKWAEERDAQPSIVKGVKGPGPGILRLDLPGYSGHDSLTPIPWEEWLEKFDEAELAFVYQDETASGVPSNFNKLVSRDSVNLTSNDAESAPSRSRGGSRPRQAASKRRAPSATPRARARSGATRAKKASSGRTAGQKAEKKRA